MTRLLPLPLLLVRTRPGLGSINTPVDPTALAAVATAIQTQEGYYPGSLAYTNNNPGNLIYTSYYASNFGASRGSPMKDKNGNTIGYFASFPDYQTGLAALNNQIQLYAGSGLTIQAMMQKYAPVTDANGNPTGNTPGLYAQNIASALGVSPDTPLADALSSSASSGTPFGQPFGLPGWDNPQPLDFGSVFASLDPTTVGLLVLVGALLLLG